MRAPDELPLKILSATFLHAAFETGQIPAERHPEIAFAGRSNVGKSSLINALLRRKKLVRTSSTPGQTQSINFFLINDAFSFVDLPGYGFAKVSKARQAAWKRLVERYLSGRSTLKAVILIMDARHPAMPQDIQLFQWLRTHSLHVIPTLTKIDKLGRNFWERSRTLCAQALGIAASQIVLFSAFHGTGTTELWMKILDVLPYPPVTNTHKAETL